MSGVDWRANDLEVIRLHGDDAHAVGLGVVWDEVVAGEQNMSRGLLLGCLGAVATYMRETGRSVQPSP